MSTLDWLTPVKSEVNDDDVVYSLDEIKAKFEVDSLTKDSYIVLKKGESWLDFAVMQRSYSDGDGKNIMLQLVFHGAGSTGLQECRHTWWGEDGDGYIFYPCGETIAKAFIYLSEFFDDMI